MLAIGIGAIRQGWLAWNRDHQAKLDIISARVREMEIKHGECTEANAVLRETCVANKKDIESLRCDVDEAKAMHSACEEKYKLLEAKVQHVDEKVKTVASAVVDNKAQQDHDAGRG